MDLVERGASYRKGATLTVSCASPRTVSTKYPATIINRENERHRWLTLGESYNSNSNQSGRLTFGAAT